MNQLNNNIFCFKQDTCDINLLNSLSKETLKFKKSEKILVHGRHGDFFRQKPKKM